MKIENEEHMKAYSNNMLVKVGSQIKNARNCRGLSIEQVAKISFSDVDIIEKIEYGDMNIKLIDIVRVLTALYIDNDIEKIACPENDDVGIFLSRYYINVEEDVDKYNF